MGDNRLPNSNFANYPTPTIGDSVLTTVGYKPESSNRSPMDDLEQTQKKKQVESESTPQRQLTRRIKTFTDLLNNNEVSSETRPEYKVHIISEIPDVDGNPIRVSAFLPENIDVDFTSAYTTPFYDNPLPGKMGDIIRAFGNTGIVQEMTYKVWDGSQGITISIPLVFVADDEYGATDRESFDINEPILKLLKLCAPSKKEGSSFLNPPGPTLNFTGIDPVLEAWQGNESETDEGSDSLQDASFFTRTSERFGRTIKSAVTFDKITSVYIGNAITLPNVVVEGVSQSYDTMFDQQGKFIRGKVNLTFSTALTPTIEDLNSFYGRSDMNIRSSSGRE